MFCFFPSITFESFSNFRITFAVCLTAHCQIHTNFTAFSVKMSNQTFVNIFFNFVCCTYADYADGRAFRPVERQIAPEGSGAYPVGLRSDRGRF